MEEQKEVINEGNQSLEIGATICGAAVAIAAEVGVGLILTAATGKILDNVELKPAERVCSTIATAVVGGVVANACDNYIYKKVETVTSTWRKITTLFKELHENPDGEE